MSSSRVFLLRQATQQLSQLSSRAAAIRLPAAMVRQSGRTCGLPSTLHNTARSLHTPTALKLAALPAFASSSSSSSSASLAPRSGRLCGIPVRTSFYASAAASAAAFAAPCGGSSSSSLLMSRRCYGGLRCTPIAASPKKSESGAGQLQGVNNLERYKGEEEEEQKEGGGEQEDPFNMNSGPGYLPFPAPFHTINIVMILFLANVLCYMIMNYGNDDWRDWIVEHCTLSHENWTRIYPLFTNAFYQENFMQLAIDCYLLWQFGDTMLGFLGNTRLAFFAMLCTLGGSLIHVARQKFELYYGMDELEVRGRCYGPNPFIMGLISMEGLIFRLLNFVQQPPIPFLVLTALVMVIDVWRIFTTKPEEHGASTGGALMAYVFWAMPTRMLGLDKLTATL